MGKVNVIHQRERVFVSLTGKRIRVSVCLSLCWCALTEGIGGGDWGLGLGGGWGGGVRWGGGVIGEEVEVLCWLSE